jgi:hypothetical protein
MRPLALALTAALGLAACRTEIRPLVKAAPAPRGRAASGPCRVQDFPSSLDVPEGAAPLGFVKVPTAASDEETFEALRRAVCARGGNAFSQPHWNREAGASVADPPFELEASAWLLPADR